MPLPSSINDLSTSAGSNSPAGSESPSILDDYLRLYASYIAILRDVSQSNSFSYAVGGGSANAITATYSPIVTTLSDGVSLIVKATATNTGATTFSPNGLTAKPIVGMAHAALQGGEIVANGEAYLVYNSSVGTGSWVLAFSTGAAEQVGNASQSQHAITAGQIQAQSVTAFTSTGTAPSYTLTPVPAITAYAASQRFRVKFHAAGAGSDTLNVSAMGAKNLKQYTATGTKVVPTIASGQIADVEYDGTDMVILNPMPGFDYVSTDQSFSAGGTLTLTHGLGVAPTRVQVEAVCTVAAQGYSVGAVISLGSYQASVTTGVTYGLTAELTSTQIIVSIGAGGILVIDKSTHAGPTLTTTSWQLRVKASRS